MRRLASLALFGVAGFTTGVPVAALLLAFAPRCGYECENRAFGVAVLSVAGCTLAFLLLGYAFTRKGFVTWFRILAGSASLAILAIAGACGHYVVELRDRYQDAQSAMPVSADMNFMYMAIATRDVRAYTKAEGGAAQPAGVIPQWQRCAIDGARCEAGRRQAHMRCQTGTVFVDESDWQAFSLIPRENLRGAVAMKSMNLCAPGNVPD
nr:hypothetical protein HUO10_000936 [Paraburkholderia busanensis]